MADTGKLGAPLCSLCKKYGLQSDDGRGAPSASDWLTGMGTTVGSAYYDEGDTFPLAAGGSASTSAGSSSPVASVDTLADWLVNGFWQNQGALPHHWASNTITYNLGNLNAQEQALALSAMNAWYEVANITFVPVSSRANISFNHYGKMQAVTNASWSGSGQMMSATIDISTDWVTTDGGANDGRTGIDSYAYQTYIHEIGHSLGLGHQGPYNGSANYSVNAIYANDTWQYSIMSYFAQSNYAGSYRYVITPQMADIYAVAMIYGASTTTRTGDTVYGFNNTAGAIYDFSSYFPAPALTIYDGGGIDTLDCSGYSNNQIIDLRAGSFSSVGGLTNNIGIALGVTLEKAVGGSGNDTLIANDAGCLLSGGGGADVLIGGAGIDRLIGGAGRDTMTGNGGADVFVFSAGDSSAANGEHDLVVDFTSEDHVDISAIGTFRFLGSVAFDGGTYALNFSYNGATGRTTLQGDINGDRVADFAIDFTGNMVFSASDIIGAVQPSSVVIESVGATSLVQANGSYFLNPVGGGTGAVLQLGGSAVSVGQFAGWTPIGAEATASGYVTAWYNAGTNAYMFWYADRGGALFASPTVPVAANDPMVQTFESSFHQDLNGDGLIAPPTVIEAFGATSLLQSGSNYFLGSTGPALQSGGSAVMAGQFAGWAPIGAEATAGGYVVAWYNAGMNAYTFWHADSNGVLLSNPTPPIAANDPAVQSFESDLHQDLNGDGMIGPATVIEAFGVTRLVEAGGNYFLAPVGGGVGLVLGFAGTAVSEGQFAGWAPIGGEATASGYQVAWYNAATNEYAFWAADSSGALLSGLPSVVAASDPLVQTFESSLHQDLNRDGVIAPPAVIEAFGATSLLQSGSNYLLGSSGPVLQFEGTAVRAGQFAGWVPVGAEGTASGYMVAWYNAGTNAYAFWSADSSGAFLSNPPLPVAANDPVVQSFESDLHQDLNGDGVVGPAHVIEAFGAIRLVESEGGNYFLSPVGGGTGSVLQFAGSAVSAGQFAGWAPIGAEATASGYQVAWYNAAADAYAFWDADSSGALVATLPGIVAANNPLIQSFESRFHQDLNGDGVVGQQPLGSTFMGSVQRTQAFEFRPDLGSQAPNLQALEDRIPDHMPAHSLADDVRSAIATVLDHLPAPDLDAYHSGQKFLAVHSDHFLIH